MTTPRRLAIVASHPIQHFTHLYRALAARDDVEIKVFFCSRIGMEAYFDDEMASTIRWAGDLTAGYPHEFLPEAATVKSIGFSSVDNPSIGSRLADFGPEAVLLHGYAQRTQLRALFWCRRKGVPALMLGDGDNVARRGTLRGAARAALLRPLFQQVSAFLTAGDQNEAMLAGLGVPRGKMFRAPFPIDEAAYVSARLNRARERARVRAALGIPEQAFVFAFVGKLSARKRPADVLAAWERLDADAQRRCALLFCGDGPEREALASRARDLGAPAFFAGFVNLDALPAHYCAADVLVHPSERDPHPLVCSEAACIGLPMILSDRVGAIGPTDIAREGVNALVHRCADVGALGEAMGRLLQEPSLCHEMAARSLAVYRECDLATSTSGAMRALDAVRRRSA